MKILYYINIKKIKKTTSNKKNKKKIKKMETIKVAIRIRPFLQYEKEENCSIETTETNEKKIAITKGKKTLVSSFDKIFLQNTKQEEIFEFIKPIINSIFEGINCTILAYGQTGSGKTYTMFGGDWTFNNLNNENINNENYRNILTDKFNFLVEPDFIVNPFSELNGIIPRIIIELFKNLEVSNDEIKINVSYIQVYNERIYDLLIDNYGLNNIKEKKDFIISTSKNEKKDKIFEQAPLKLRDDKRKGVIIQGAREINVNTFYDVFQILKKGELNRKKRETNKNDMSSRSHTIFIIYYNNITKKLTSKVSFCDLAGSEKYDIKEKYEDEHLNEMKSINKSLSVLGNVIHALARKNNESKKKNFNTINGNKKDNNKNNINLLKNKSNKSLKNNKSEKSFLNNKNNNNLKNKSNNNNKDLKQTKNTNLNQSSSNNNKLFSKKSTLKNQTSNKNIPEIKLKTQTNKFRAQSAKKNKVNNNRKPFISRSKSQKSKEKSKDKNSTTQEIKFFKIHIPYKDSQLTYLLKDSIGGNSKTILIANISPNLENFDETYNTILFALRANKIESKIISNKLIDDTLLIENVDNVKMNKLNNEVKELRNLLEIRTKRGTLKPIQEEYLKLKEENLELRNYVNNINDNNISKIILENQQLKKEIKQLKNSKELEENKKNTKVYPLYTDNNIVINNYNEFSIPKHLKYNKNKKLDSYEGSLLSRSGRSVVYNKNRSFIKNKNQRPNSVKKQNNYFSYINTSSNNNYTNPNLYNFNNENNDNNEMFDSELAEITKKRLDKLDEMYNPNNPKYQEYQKQFENTNKSNNRYNSNENNLDSYDYY